MSVRIGHLRFWLLRKFGSIFSWLDSNDNQLAKGLYGLCRWFWETVTPSKVFHIVSFTEYLSNHLGTVVHLKTNRIGYAANAVIIGKREKQILKEVPLPDLNLYCLENVYIHHGSDFVVNLNERLLINDYCATKNDDNKGYEDQWCYWQEGKVAIVRKSKDGKCLESGIMLLDKYSFNYYHNMYENLIRLCVLDEFNDHIPEDVPIVIDEEVYNIQSFSRIFEILTENIKRPIVVSKKDELLSIGELYYITHVNNLVPLHKCYAKSCDEDYVFDKDYTLRLRNILLLQMDTKKVFPKYIFITRKNTSKRHFNEEELFAELKQYGFQMIAPEEYSFEEQMKLFNGAKWIVGGTGAAFTNLLFSSPSCNIVCLFRNSKHITGVFTAPVYFNGAIMRYFQSRKGTGKIEAHTDFSIDVDDFRQFVNDFMEHANS